VLGFGFGSVALTGALFVFGVGGSESLSSEDDESLELLAFDFVRVALVCNLAPSAD
jgi:hypothetical protein